MAATPAFHRLYAEVATIRSTLGFRLLSAQRLSDGRPCVLVVPHRESAASAQAIDRAARAHARIEHPAVPRTHAVVELAGRRVLDLDSNAIADGLTLFRRMSTGSVRMPYPAADAMIHQVNQAMKAAHRLVDEDTGGPLCLGRIATTSVLYGPDGHTSLVGFGHNFAIEDEHGHPDPAIPHFQAVELSMGAPKTPETDYHALHSLMRSGISLVDKADALGKILAAITTRSDMVLFELLEWVERRVNAVSAADRPSNEESERMAWRIREVLGVRPDLPGFEALAARVLLDPRLEPPPPSHEKTLLLGPGGEWFRVPGGELVRLRGPMRRILVVLADEQRLGSQPVRTVDLTEVGWPDERIEHEAALNRVYVTMNRLKKLVPDGIVERFEDGYRLAADVVVRRVAP